MRGKETSMKLLAVRRRHCGALVDVQISPGVRLFNLTLAIGTDGHHRLRAPNAFGTRTATFDPSIIQAVAAAVQKEPLADGRQG
jgi:hypothetical protein